MSTAATLDSLRARIASIQLEPCGGAGMACARAASGQAEGTRFGLAALDARFGARGLADGAHQIAGAPGDGASALLFALLIAARKLKADPAAQALVVQERAALSEAGGLYSPGLGALGLDYERIAVVEARDSAEALRMTDEAARCGAASVVVAETPRAGRLIDLTATQRLNLHGRQTATLVLLVTPDLEATSAALTRWRVRAARSRASRRFVGPPALDLELTRNRLGPVGRMIVEWSREDEAFRTPAPLRPSLVRPPGYRQAGRPADGPGPTPGLGPAPERRLAAYGGQ